jgi:MFS transporter, DHA1 family, multidrug resistance protein
MNQGTAESRNRGVAGNKEFIAMVTAFMALGALAIDIMIPAFPDMRREFGMAADSTDVGWIITAFFLGVAVGPWLYGPASDRYGRKKPLAVGTVLYIASAVFACLAPSWGWVKFSRFVWGLGAGAPRAIATAMIRDRYEGDAMARLMSTLMAVFLLVPIIAPSFGAGLIAIFPWRAVFICPAILTTLLLVWSRRLPETLAPERRRPFTWSSVGRAVREVVTHRQTITFTLAVMFLFSVMTAYLAGSEVIVEDVYGLGPWFPLIFGCIAFVFSMNSLNNARLVRRHGTIPLIRRLVVVATSSAGFFLVVAYFSDGKPPFWLYMVAVVLVVPIAQGLNPLCNTAAMMPVAHIAGTASSVMATVTTAGGALLGGLASDRFDGTVRPLATWLFGFITIAALLVLFGTKSARQEESH